MRRREQGITQPGEPVRMPAAGRVCGLESGPAWCEEDVFARGLCRPHYRRRARGVDLDPDAGRRVGVTPSGHGRWGTVDVDGDGRLRCHECGRWYASLAVHIGMVHGSVRDYRFAHGLTMSLPLVSEPVRLNLAAAASRPEVMQRVADARDPRRALAAVDPSSLREASGSARGHRKTRPTRDRVRCLVIIACRCYR